MAESLEFHAAAIPGTESALCDELRELGLSSVRFNRGGIPFRGAWPDGWRACLHSRIAQRVQVLLCRFPAPSEQALYDGVQRVDWRAYIGPAQTLAVGAVTVGSALTHSGYVALKTKDAIVDQLRAATGARPSVSRDDPDVRVFVYLASDRAALYLDLSGEALHRRGYRQQTGEAPLRETLAAAVLRLSGWDRRAPLLDPMCGSGTLAIEAALWAANRAPGLGRERFGFERWANFGPEEAEAMRALRGEARRNVRPDPPRVQASDLDPAMIEKAGSNARAAGVRLGLAVRDIADLRADGRTGVLVSNPPYGVRLETDPDFFRRVAAAVSRLHGWRVALLAGSKAYERWIAARPVKTFPLPNGSLDCDLLLYDMP